MSPTPTGGVPQPLRLRQSVVSKTGAAPFGQTLRRVIFDKINYKESDVDGVHNGKIIEDSLQALIDAQNQDALDVDTWIHWTEQINNDLSVSGLVPSLEKEIEEFYTQVEELSFLSNPFLREAWQRCLDATRSVAAKSKYSSVGGKFNKQATNLLAEIATDFPTLAPLCIKVTNFIPGMNKEHMINKGVAYNGPQTAHFNLMGASTPEPGNLFGSISPFHASLHKMKTGTGTLNYNLLDPKIQAIIAKCQKNYSSSSMGTFK